MRTATLFNQQSMLVDDDDCLGLTANGLFEPDETRSLLGLARPGDRVLDVGANIGYYTVLLAERVGPRGRVFAIEPSAQNHAVLDANTTAWQQEGRVRLFRAALSDKPGSAELFLSTHNAGMHRLYGSVVCAGASERIETLRGDDLGLAPLDLIKIDIEGYEPFALQGLKATLRASPQVTILSEFSPLSMLEAGASPSQWLRWMSALGLVPLALEQGRWRRSACAGLMDAVQRLEAMDFPGFLQSVQGLDNPTILARAIEAAAAAGYDRPVLENLFFTRPNGVVAIEALRLS